MGCGDATGTEARAARTAMAIALLLLLGFWARAGETRPISPGSYTEKCDYVPDFRQTDESLPKRGTGHCGPAAAANVLAWLNDHGYPGLVPPESSRPVECVMMDELGLLMRTIAGKGTFPQRLMAGLQEYCRARRYTATIEYEGWFDGGEYTRAGRPDLAWLCEGVQGESNVLLLIGFYRHAAMTDTYVRAHSHWVTMVGYEGADGAEPRLIVHDPGRPRGSIPYRLATLQSGTFARAGDFPEGPAAGWFTVTGTGLGKDADVAVIDGAIRIRVSKRWPLGGHVVPEPTDADGAAR